MPILKHAKKKLKQDKKRTLLNKKVKNTFKLALKTAKAEKNAKTVSAAFKAIDKAVKANLIHKNKAARIKSGLSKLIAGSKPAAKSPSEKTAKPKPTAKPKTAAAKSSKTSGTKTKKSSSKK